MTFPSFQGIIFFLFVPGFCVSEEFGVEIGDFYGNLKLVFLITLKTFRWNEDFLNQVDIFITSSISSLRRR